MKKRSTAPISPQKGVIRFRNEMSTTAHPMNMSVKSALEPCRDRLDSWKQIAVYLDREVRTVQRWEKNEGLPVHRHIHLNGGTVYALKEEIDVWLTGRGQTASKCCPLQRRSRQAAKGLNPSLRVIRQLLSAFGLWLAVVATDSDQDSDDLVVANARLAPRGYPFLTQRPQS